MNTLVAYALTLAAALFAITSLPVSIGGGILARISGSMALGSISAATITWLLIDLAWRRFEGGALPLAASGSAIALLAIHHRISHDELNQNAKILMSAECWGIIAAAAVSIIIGPFRLF